MILGGSRQHRLRPAVFMFLLDFEDRTRCVEIVLEHAEIGIGDAQVGDLVGPCRDVVNLGADALL